MSIMLDLDGYTLKVETLKQLDFLVEMYERSLYIEFCVKGTNILIRPLSDGCVFWCDYETGWQPLENCFEKLPKDVQEKLIWHLDLFK